MMLRCTAPFMLQAGSAAPSPVKPLSPPGKGAERKLHRELAELWLLSSLGMWRSLAGGSKAAPAVGHGVGFVRWYPGCPVIPPLRLYRQRRVLKTPQGAGRVPSQGFPTSWYPGCSGVWWADPWRWGDSSATRAPAPRSRDVGSPRVPLFLKAN